MVRYSGAIMFVVKDRDFLYRVYLSGTKRWLPDVPVMPEPNAAQPDVAVRQGMQLFPGWRVRKPG